MHTGHVGYSVEPSSFFLQCSSEIFTFGNFVKTSFLVGFQAGCYYSIDLLKISSNKGSDLKLEWKFDINIDGSNIKPEKL